jgi:hypothetical protein
MPRSPGRHPSRRDAVGVRPMGAVIGAQALLRRGDRRA